MTYDERHIANTVAYAKRLDAAFIKVADQVSAMVNDPYAKFSSSFAFKDNHVLSKKADVIFENLQKEVEQIITDGYQTEWQLSNNKNDALVKSFVKNIEVLKLKPDWTNRNLSALKAFTSREVEGIKLSDRVWKIAEQARQEMEVHLGFGILNGDSADVISRRIRQYLNDPEALFRRVRNQVGELQWSKAAKALEPGTGKYRSSYKNARRLTVTETNMAYRNADHERWSQLGFVIGYEVKLSGSHPALDICDTLKGQYPKTFFFTGWHPQCLCHAVAIQMSAEQKNAYQDSILDGTDQEFLKTVKTIDKVPQDFTKWIYDNNERAKGWKSLPYFVKDNPIFAGSMISDRVYN